MTCLRGLMTRQFYVAWKRFYVMAKELIFTSDSLFICTQVSHLQFPVDNYLGIKHKNTYSIKLKYFWSSLRWRLACKLVPKGVVERCYLPWKITEDYGASRNLLSSVKKMLSKMQFAVFREYVHIIFHYKISFSKAYKYSTTSLVVNFLSSRPVLPPYSLVTARPSVE